MVKSKKNLFKYGVNIKMKSQHVDFGNTQLGQIRNLERIFRTKQGAAKQSSDTRMNMTVKNKHVI